MNLSKKISMSLSLDVQWLSCPQIPTKFKLQYLFRKYWSLILHSQSIPWLGIKEFAYDNKNTPATLQSYPIEIGRLLKTIKKENPTILDIGANIGQFATTAAFFKPNAEIYCFEPNPHIYTYLTINTQSLKSVRCFNHAVGPTDSSTFYYVPGWSGKGSFIRNNASINLIGKVPTALSVSTIELNSESLSKLPVPSHFDLIKIDVEGYEMNVLNAMPAMSSDYIYVEASVNRERGYNLIDLLDRLKKISPHADLLYIEQIDLDNKKQTIVNILVGPPS